MPADHVYRQAVILCVLDGNHACAHLCEARAQIMIKHQSQESGRRRAPLFNSCKSSPRNRNTSGTDSPLVDVISIEEQIDSPRDSPVPGRRRTCSICRPRRIQNAPGKKQSDPTHREDTNDNYSRSHACLKFGLRFSRNALIPSLKSSVSQQSPKSNAS